MKDILTDRQRHKDATSQRILESALKVFSLKGYRDATIQEIHELAGCNALTVFRHFQDKESLFFCVVKQYKDIQVDTSVLCTALDFDHLEESLCVLSKQYFKALFQNLEILRIFINECTAFPALKEDAWLLCPPLSAHFASCLAPARLCNQEQITELFIGYITKLCLECNTQDRIWEYSDTLLESFSLKMNRQIAFISKVIRKQSRAAG